MGRRLGVAVATVALGAQLVALPAARSWPGDPDGGFGNCGHAIVHAGHFNSFASSVVTQPDAKILIGGERSKGGGLEGRPIVGRLTSVGAFDTSFSGGYVYLADNTSEVRLALQGDGKIVAATNAFVVRLTTTGAFDSSFGNGGRVASSVSNQGVLVQPDGAIVTIGGGAHATRFTSTGVLDGTFGSAGQASLPLEPRALARQPDGKLVVAGTVPNGNGSDFAITRLNPDGTPDMAFGTNGLVVDDVRSVDRLNGLVLTNGGIVVSGYSNQKIGMVRHNADGSRDTTFGFGGVVLTRVGAYTYPVALGVTADNKLVVSGSARFGIDSDLFVVRYRANGQIDPGFGFGGAAIIDRNPGNPIALTVQPDGRVVVAGSVQDYDKFVISLWRFQPDGSTASYADVGYVLDGYGGLHSVSSGCAGTSPPPVGAPYWSGWDIARDVVTLFGGEGYVLDGYGGLHGFNFYAPSAPVIPPPQTYGGPYWRGWDIARAVAVLPDESGGYVLDGYGGLHPFGIYGAPPPATAGGPSWAGWDIARGAVILPNGQGGYVLDGYGGIHRFAIDGGPLPPAAVGGPTWPGWDIARSITLLPDASGGYVLDGYGGLHPFSIGNGPRPPAANGGPTWPGWDIARGVSLFR